MLSKPDVYSRLARHFIGLRFDWEQGNHYKDRFGFILGTGDQMILDPAGKPISHTEKTKDGRSSVIYGRHGCDTTGAVLDKVIAAHTKGSDELKLDWFLWPDKPARRQGGRYPAPFNSMAGYARLPLAFVHGDVPGALRDSDFLRWHVRQFIWVRGETNGPGRIIVKRVKDGLKPGLSTEIAAIDCDSLSKLEIGQALDAAWMEYMKHRPLTARGYLDNPHGKWMRSVKNQMISEEQDLRSRAAAGTLLPPGRNPGERAPYS
ncbi:MAG: hypothetical protein L0Y58_19495 [Verrucomicrobia subdivision 3 bacterium]|nr:hypothetical protein [Limisphaerales bacterium]